MFELANDYWQPLHIMTVFEPYSDCVNAFREKIFSALSVIETLRQLFKYSEYPTIFDQADFKPTSSEAIKMQERLFEKLNAAGDGQTFALKGQRAYDVYFQRGFVLMREFKFLTDGSVQPDTESMAIYNQFLPFSSDRQSDRDCVPVEGLPPFYKNKGHT